MAKGLKPGSKGRAPSKTKAGKAKAERAAKKAAKGGPRQLSVEDAINAREREEGRQEATEQQIAQLFKRLDNQVALVDRAKATVKEAQQVVRERKASLKAIKDTLANLNIPVEVTDRVLENKKRPVEELDLLHRLESKVYRAIGVPISYPVGMADEKTGKSVATALEEAAATGNGKHPAFKSRKEANDYWLADARKKGTECGQRGGPITEGDMLKGPFRAAYREAWQIVQNARAEELGGAKPAGRA